MDLPGNSAFNDNDFWHKSNRLPHYDRGNIYQCITYRLADSLPQNLRHEGQSITLQSQHRQMIENTLDRGYGKCLLKNRSVAKIVLNTWRFFDLKRYQIIAYVIMPNHCHILIAVFRDSDLAKIIHSWKRFSSKEIHQLYPEDSPHVWQNDYWDRFIRDEKHFFQCINYIHQNPVKAGLCAQPIDWTFSSARIFERDS